MRVWNICFGRKYPLLQLIIWRTWGWTVGWRSWADISNIVRGSLSMGPLEIRVWK